jgi:hypothetical protein
MGDCTGRENHQESALLQPADCRPQRTDVGLGCALAAEWVDGDHQLCKLWDPIEQLVCNDADIGANPAEKMAKNHPFDCAERVIGDYERGAASRD